MFDKRIGFLSRKVILFSHEPLGRCPQGKANTRKSRNMASRYALAVGCAECTRPGGKAQV